MTDAVAAQVRAATPSASSWVSANAGSGKTRVLTDRVARLLLAGTEPQRILCLTYTKAAAAEMQNRLFKTLGAWAMLDDAALRAALAALGEPGEAVPPAELARARTLFARALETPGGLKIQTIHAFCEALLRRFPLEAGVAPQFGVLDDRQARALRAEVLDELAQRETGGVRGAGAVPLGGRSGRAAAGDRPAPDGFRGGVRSGRLGAAIGAEPGLTAAALAAEVLTPDAEALLRALVPVLAGGGVNDAKAGALLAAVLATSDPEARLQQLEEVLLTGGTPRSRSRRRSGSFRPRGCGSGIRRWSRGSTR